MAISRIIIENFKSIKKCDINIKQCNLFIGENGSGKTNILEALEYFYSNLTSNNIRTDIFDVNNKYSNELKITVYYDMHKLYSIAKHKLDNIKEKSAYDGYYNKIVKANASNKKGIKVQLLQTKNKNIKWKLPFLGKLLSNDNFENRAFVKNMFPLYKVDSRKIDVEKWDELWEFISEYIKVSKKDTEEFSEKIIKDIQESSTFNKKLEILQQLFAALDVDVGKFKSDEYAKLIAKTYFKGETFYKESNGLGFFSTGTNLINYLKIVINILSLFSKNKLKDSTLLLDEPEMNLHTSYIDELTELLTDECDVSLFVATHSPRLVKNVVKNNTNILLYKILLKNKYSQINKMELFTEKDDRAKYWVTDEQINAYFSKALVIVEGESELELLQNPYLLALFPQVKKIEVFKGMADDVTRKIIQPSIVKSNIPFCCLIDADKALSYGAKIDSYKGTGDIWQAISNVSEKEYLLFNNKKELLRFKIHTKRKKIDEIIKTNKFLVDLKYFSTEDIGFYSLLSLVRGYLLNYNCFMFNNTLEGTLINSQTINIMIEFMYSNNNKRTSNDLKKELSSLSPTNKVNLIRTLYGGKTDLLKKKKDIDIPEPLNKIIDRDRLVSTKTSGWITEFLEYYFINTTNKEDFHSFKIHIRDNQNYKKIKQQFKKDFSELHVFLNHLEQLIS